MQAFRPSFLLVFLSLAGPVVAFRLNVQLAKTVIQTADATSRQHEQGWLKSCETSKCAGKKAKHLFYGDTAVIAIKCSSIEKVTSDDGGRSHDVFVVAAELRVVPVSEFNNQLKDIVMKGEGLKLELPENLMPLGSGNAVCMEECTFTPTGKETTRGPLAFYRTARKQGILLPGKETMFYRTAGSDECFWAEDSEE